MANRYINYNQIGPGMLIQFQSYSLPQSHLIFFSPPFDMSYHPEKPKRRSDMACRRCRARKLKVFLISITNKTLLTFQLHSAKIRIVWHRAKGVREKKLNAYLSPLPTTPSHQRPQIIVAAAQRTTEVNQQHLPPQPMGGPQFKGCLRSPMKHSRQGTLFSRSLMFECAPDACV